MSKQPDALESIATLLGGSADFVEGLYESYLKDPSSVAPDWKALFDSLTPVESGHLPEPRSLPDLPDQGGEGASFPSGAEYRSSMEAAEKQAAVLRLIDAYRYRGHQYARTDPLGFWMPPASPELDPSFHDLTHSDLDRMFHPGSLAAPDRMPLAEILSRLRKAYCGAIGAEYMYITSTQEKRWIQQQIEPVEEEPLHPERRIRLLNLLRAAQAFEESVCREHPDHAPHSLEGSEALLPLLVELIELLGTAGVKEVVLGMGSRGRLTVMSQLLGITPDMVDGGGSQVDVGSLTLCGNRPLAVDTPGGPVRVSLVFQPRLPEVVGGLLTGIVRARLEERADPRGTSVVPVWIHHDLDIAARGMVMETLSLSQTSGYSCGGTIHVVLNEQYGNPMNVRSSLYCTDVSKTVQAPVFHVNADDPEAVLKVTRSAAEFRMEFSKDVVIDLVGYHRRDSEELSGAIMQPIKSSKVLGHPSVASMYRDRLVQEGVLEDAGELSTETRAKDPTRAASRASAPHPIEPSPWDYTDGRSSPTGISREDMKQLIGQVVVAPENFTPHPELAPFFSSLRAAQDGCHSIDWTMAELLAYAAAITSGYPVRRASAGRDDSPIMQVMEVHDVSHGEIFIPLRHVDVDQGPVGVIHSPSTQDAVLAFEYGYALAAQFSLVVWDNRFNESLNDGRTIVEEIVIPGHERWRNASALILMFPLQTPDHAGKGLPIERFLPVLRSVDARLCLPSMSAQLFHLLREQTVQQHRRPLFLVLPTGLLSMEESYSPADDLTESEFQQVIVEHPDSGPEAVKRMIFCVGSIYHGMRRKGIGDLFADTAWICIEQIHPFPHAEIASAIGAFPRVKDAVWCQTEFLDRGLWPSLKGRLAELLPGSCRHRLSALQWDL